MNFNTFTNPITKLLVLNGAVGLVLGWMLSLTLAVNAADAPASEASPHEVIRGTSSELVELIERARSYVDEDPDRYHTEVQALLDPVVDFKSFSRLVMATHYKKATVEQRKRFASSFKRSLVKTYASALMQFSNQEIKVLDPTRAPRDPAGPL